MDRRQFCKTLALGPLGLSATNLLTSGATIARAAETVSSPLLEWTPPVLNNPHIVNDSGGTYYPRPGEGYGKSYPPDLDVVFVLGNQTRTQQLQIYGGRNLRIVGGGIQPTSVKGAYVLRCFQQTASIYLEGLDLDASIITQGGTLCWGVVVGGLSQSQAPDIYLQNMRITGVDGRHASLHGDCYQAQGAISNVRMDKITARTGYQAIFLPEINGYGPTSVTLKRVDMDYQLVTGDDMNSYLLWLPTKPGSTPPIDLDQVYATCRSGTVYGRQITVDADAVWPSTSFATTVEFRPNVSNGVIVWPSVTNITGSVIVGRPPGGAFVPEGSVGPGYVSPGYRR